MSSEVVRFEELGTASGHRVGVATLNAPASLNALSLAMVRALTPALDRWADERDVACVVLQGEGEKAFCAGGDLRELYDSLVGEKCPRATCTGAESIKASPGEPSAYARGFFAEEYELDYRIHTYDKPILCWGHGIVMGGGIGLMSGASHRVVTGKSRLAMPEITVGLYPDVGGSWLLGRMPGRIGLFLALTGASLDGADALFCGLADAHVDQAKRGDVMAALQGASWSDAPRANHATLSRVLAAHETSAIAPSNVQKNFNLLRELARGDLPDVAARLRAFRTEDPWLSTALTTFAKGSPTSAALSFELQRRTKHSSLADVFRAEYDVSLGCCAHADFAEGIRALLIDKDKNPRWTPASLEGVTAALVDDHFRPRYAGEHPLASIGKARS